MFVMRGECAVRGAEGPAIAILDHPRWARSDHGLERDHESRREHAAGGRVAKVRHRRALVDASSNAVAAQLPHHGEAVPLHLAFDGAAELGERGAGAGGAERRCEGLTRAPLQRARRAVRRRDENGDGGIGDVAIELERHIELDDIAAAEHARAGNAVHDLIVHADAGESWKVVRELRRGTRAFGASVACGDVVERAGRDTGPDRAAHLGERARDEMTGALKSGEVGGGLDGHETMTARAYALTRA